MFMEVSIPKNPKHQRQYQNLVTMNTPEVEILRMIQVFGNNDAFFYGVFRVLFRC